MKQKPVFGHGFAFNTGATKLVSPDKMSNVGETAQLMKQLRGGSGEGTDRNSTESGPLQKKRRRNPMAFDPSIMKAVIENVKDLENSFLDDDPDIDML